MNGLGYKRNPNRWELRSFSAHRFASLPYAPKDDLSPFSPPIFDQGQTGSCVGHARSRGLYTSSAAVGNSIPFIPSPVDIYQLARCFEYAGELQDNGCDPVDSIRAVSRFGIRPMNPLPDRFSDADPSTVNNRPDLLALETDYPNRSDGDYQIDAVGDQRVQQVLSCLGNSCAVCIDVPGGSDDWQNYSGGVLKANGQPNDHYVCLVGYDTTVSSGVVFKGHNSWGESWGAQGTFLIDASVILAATDIIVNVYHLES